MSDDQLAPRGDGTQPLFFTVAAEQLRTPFFRCRVDNFSGRFRDRRKVFHPFVRTSRVDDRARVEALLVPPE